MDKRLADGIKLWTTEWGGLPGFSDAQVFICDAGGVPLAGSLSVSENRSGADAGGAGLLERAVQSAAERCLEQREAVETEALPSGRLWAFPISTERHQGAAVIVWKEAPRQEAGTVLFYALERLLAGCMTLAEERFEAEELKRFKQMYRKRDDNRETLFQAMKKLLTLTDVNEVLSTVITHIRDAYPGAGIDIYLAQDHHCPDLPVKPLKYLNRQRDLCNRAFMEGKVLQENRPGSEGGSLAVPLTGKQGHYGVMLLQEREYEFDEEDIRFFSTLGEAAGSAFENSKLYEQSNYLIAELRLINEITRRLSQSLKLHEVYKYASDELLHIFKADYCCILQFVQEQGKIVVQASNLPAINNEIFEDDYGFSGRVISTKEPLIISDYYENLKVKSKLMEETQSRSLIAAPMIVHDEVVGVIMVTHGLPGYFTYDNYKLLQVLSGHIGMAMTNASLHAEVRRMVITDRLTGLFARHYLDEQVNHLQKKDSVGSLILIDIDDFKLINDTHGHQVGDRTLVQVSGIIRACIREGDIPARWGGEEIAVYLPQVRLEQAIGVAERIRCRISLETEPPVTASCGLAQWSGEDEQVSVETLFYRADMAMYEAKNAGKNQLKIAR